MNMREFITLAAFPAGTFIAQGGVTDLDGWGRLYERMGIALISLLIAGVLAWILYKKGEKQEAARTAAILAAEAERAKNLATSEAERLAMQTEIRDLNKAQLAMMVASSDSAREMALRYERVVSEQGQALRMLTTKLKRYPHKLEEGEG